MSASCLASELPEDCRFYPADTKEELHKVIPLDILITANFIGSILKSPVNSNFVQVLSSIHKYACFAVHVAVQRATPFGSSLAEPAILYYVSGGMCGCMRELCFAYRHSCT